MQTHTDTNAGRQLGMTQFCRTVFARLGIYAFYFYVFSPGYHRVAGAYNNLLLRALIIIACTTSVYLIFLSLYLIGKKNVHTVQNQNNN